MVASLIQLQDLALESGRTTPLHVVAPVRHPRTIQLINYITSHSHKAAGNSQKEFGGVEAVTDNQHQHVSRGTHGGTSGHASVKAQGRKQPDGGGTTEREGRLGVVMDVDVLLPDELLSGLLTQVSVQPELLSVMNELFDAQGMYQL